MELPGTTEGCSRCITPWNATGARCFAAAAVRVTFRGPSSIGSESSSPPYGDQSWHFLMRRCELLPCCESISEERSAGNPHPVFCESRRRATASGDLVWGRNPPGYPIRRKPSVGLLCQQPAIVLQWCLRINQHRNPIRQSIRH
jgi:hypothetical protein